MQAKVDFPISHIFNLIKEFYGDAGSVNDIACLKTKASQECTGNVFLEL